MIPLDLYICITIKRKSSMLKNKLILDVGVFEYLVLNILLQWHYSSAVVSHIFFICNVNER